MKTTTLLLICSIPGLLCGPARAAENETTLGGLTETAVVVTNAPSRAEMLTLSNALSIAVTHEAAARAQVAEALGVHTNRTDNPHAVTASQTGALASNATAVAASRLISDDLHLWDALYIGATNITIVTTSEEIETYRSGDSWVSYYNDDPESVLVEIAGEPGEWTLTHNGGLYGLNWDYQLSSDASTSLPPTNRADWTLVYDWSVGLSENVDSLDYNALILGPASDFATPGDISTAIAALGLDTMSQEDAGDYYTAAEIDTEIAAAIPQSAYCVGGYRNDSYWTVGTEPRYRGYSGAVTSTADDVIQVDYESDGQFLDAQASIDYLRGLPDDGVLYSVIPTNRASIGTNGYVTTISPGIVTVSATIDGTTRSATDYLGYAAGRALSAWTSGVSGSVRRASQDQVDDALAAAGDSPDTDYWATIEHSTTNYVANTNCWAADADLSGVVVASKHPGDADFGNAQWHGTLISPRHIVLAKHAVAGVPNHLASKSEEIGTQKRFVGQSGTVYERTVSAHYDPMSTSPYTNLLAWGSDYGDTIIGKLDSALPTNDVAVYAVLPSDYADYFPNGFAGKPSGADTFAGGGAVCGIWTGFDRDVHAVEFSSYKSFSSAPTRDETFRPARAGDSGRPAFLWLPSGLTLVLNVTYPTIGPDIATSPALRAGVGAILAADGYSLQSADFDGYTNFGGAE